MPADRPIIQPFVLGPFQTNAYVIASGRDVAVVDPGFEPDDLLAWLAREGLAPAHILLTHGHVDHIAGIAELRRSYPDTRIACPAGDAFMLADPAANLSTVLGVPIAVRGPHQLLQPGSSITIGNSTWQVLDTAGHTPGGVSFYCDSAATVITGDALFAGSIGRCDLPGSSIKLLLANIHDQLLVLPDNTAVLPGHGPATTVGAERRSNPFLQNR